MLNTQIVEACFYQTLSFKCSSGENWKRNRSIVQQYLMNSQVIAMYQGLYNEVSIQDSEFVWHMFELEKSTTILLINYCCRNLVKLNIDL